MGIPWLFVTTLLKRPRRTGTALGGAHPLLSQATEIPAFRRALPHLARELARARRYQRPLSVVVLSVAGGGVTGRPVRSGGNGNNGGNHPVSPCVSVLLGSLLREVFRESDLVTYDSLDDRYVMLLPESQGTSARQAVERLDHIVFERTLVHLGAGIAEFPADGLILEDLVERARRAWLECPVPGSAEEKEPFALPSGAEPQVQLGTAMSLPDEL